METKSNARNSKSNHYNRKDMLGKKNETTCDNYDKQVHIKHDCLLIKGKHKAHQVS